MSTTYDEGYQDGFEAGQAKLERLTVAAQEAVYNWNPHRPGSFHFDETEWDGYIELKKALGGGE